MNMFKRRDRTLLSPSSSRRENVPHTHQRVKPVGCMAGVFHLISKYHRRRKFLTSGSNRQSEEGNENRREVPGKVITICSESSEQMVDDDDEKGRRLMEELRKCDEDLRKIQRVLEEARAARSFILPENREGDRRQPPEQRQRLTSFKTTACKTSLNNNNFSWGHAKHSLECKFIMKKKMMSRDSILNVAQASLSMDNGCDKDRPPTLILLLRWSDRVVKESVEETCMDMGCQQKREFAKIGLDLQESIYSDLIEEIISFTECKDVSFGDNVMTTKNQMSRRRLCMRSLRF